MSTSCYWCGNLATTREHVPPRCFFPKAAGVPLITVPSCEDHNRNLSKLDERFRFYLQVASNSTVATSEFQSVTYRSLQRPEASKFAANLTNASYPARLDGRQTLAFDIDPKAYNLFFEKILRAIYFTHFATPFSGRVFSACTHLVNRAVDYRALIPLVKTMESSLYDGIKTHDDVFRYRYGRTTEANGEGFAVIATFYNEITLFGFGLRENSAPHHH